MDGVYKELEELKAELEKLKDEYRIKTELSESLRRAHIEQISKNQEAKLQIEKQAKELNEKSEELAEVRQLYGEVTSKLREMESSLKQVSSVNEKMRIDNGEKVQKLEEENRKLVSAIEEATGKNDELEAKLCACNKEVKGLKNLLSESQKKCFEAEEKAREGRELRHREEVISKLEEQSMSVQDQLKWKKEQFEHLEEAHRRLQDLFQSSKKEWASEKSGMLEEMTALQLKLDSQMRVTESLESRLKMCNQALAHEESRRKTLEVQLSESKQNFENVLAEYEEAKSKLESFNTKRDEDIADMRNSLGMKDILMKELDYKVTHLEQENKELLESLKELREAQINKRKVDPSLNKLRNKLKDLEQVHSNCSLALKEREVEWNSKMEKLLGDMRSYESDIKTQSEQLDQLKMQLDNCHSAMEVSDEETSILLLMMKSELSDAYSKLFKTENQVEISNKERVEMNTDSSAQSFEVMGDCSPSNAKVHAKQAHEKIAILTQKLDSIKALEERSTSLESALVEHKKMLEESSACQLRSREQLSQMEVALKNMSSALEKSNSTLEAKINEAKQTKMELQIWKSKAESFKTCLEQCQEVCKQMETSLLEQVETEKVLREENESYQCKMKEKDQKIKDLEQKADSVEHKLIQNEAAIEAMKLEVVEAYKKAENYVNIINEKDAIVQNLQKEIKVNEEQSMKREVASAEAARLEAENNFELEKEELCRAITAEKDGQIRCIQEFASSLEQNFVEVVLFSFSQGIEDMFKIVALQDTLEKSEVCMNTEMERKNNAINVLKKEISDLQGRMLLQEKSLLHSEQSVKELEALIEFKKLDTQKLLNQCREEQAKLNKSMKDLEQEKEASVANIKRLSFERDNLLTCMEGFCDQFGEFCAEDVKLQGMLVEMLQNSNTDDVTSNKSSNLLQKDVKKEVDVNIDRYPLREINQ